MVRKIVGNLIYYGGLAIYGMKIASTAVDLFRKAYILLFCRILKIYTIKEGFVAIKRKSEELRK